LAAALRRLTSDAELREALARRGKARVSVFTWDKAVRETWDVYRDLLRGAAF
jgi:glycosyltransferase involved in cell wall biosynthesis